jgi:NAD(P)-dependent dehydrogenase (short-subunit alcohol dehydrogenase family)
MAITLITGANKGIGYETARQLADVGHTVYIGARSVERGQKAAADLGARFVQLDVTDDASVAAAMKTIDDAEGRLDVLVNNAGIGLEARNGPDALKVFDTAHPVVVNVSSALGSFWAVTNPERPAFRVPAIVYGASKAAVSMLTLQYAKAVPEVKFNAVEPGYTATDLGGANHGGRPVEESAKVVVRVATIGPDGPTGTFQEDAGELPW